MIRVGDTITMTVHLKNSEEERTGRVIEIPKHRRFAVVLFRAAGGWGKGGFYRECYTIQKAPRMQPDMQRKVIYNPRKNAGMNEEGR